jgi:hypothetical protein
VKTFRTWAHGWFQQSQVRAVSMTVAGVTYGVLVFDDEGARYNAIQYLAHKMSGVEKQLFEESMLMLFTDYETALTALEQLENA